MFELQDVFFSGIKGPNAYSGCTKCTVVGEYDNGGHHMSFPKFDCPLRTHDDFINRVDDEHHLVVGTARELKKTPLEDIIGIDMIKSFPIDCMHLVELGNICSLCELKRKLYVKSFLVLSNAA